jgi:hypothetical protein
MMRLALCTALVASLALLGGCATGTDAVVEPKTTISDPRPVAAAEDIFNQAVMAALTPGMIITVRISPSGIELQQVHMMLVPKNPRRADGQGDRIIVTSLGNGSPVSKVAATDPVVLFLEEKGQARQEDRTVSLAVPTPTLVDTLEVTVTASGESRKFDVSPVIRDYCARAEGSPTCRAASPDARNR